jgi:membrane protein implicated in regulation of membrane protease activity
MEVLMIWVFSVDFWLIIGTVMVFVEIFTGDFTALSFGIAAYLVTAVLLCQPTLFLHWYNMLLLYSIFTLLIAIASRRLIDNDAYDISH